MNNKDLEDTIVAMIKKNNDAVDWDAMEGSSALAEYLADELAVAYPTEFVWRIEFKNFKFWPRFEIKAFYPGKLPNSFDFQDIESSLYFWAMKFIG